MKLKTVILIGIFFAALFFVVVYVDKKKAKKREKSTTLGELLTLIRMRWTNSA